MRKLNKRNVFKVKNLSRKQAQLLKEGRLPLSMFVGFLGGTGAQMVFSNEVEPEIEAPDPFSETTPVPEEEELYEFEAPAAFEFSDKVSDDMSFSEAYKAARADTGAGGFFNWKGNSYHTLTKEEWDALPEEERAAISRKIQENTHFESSEYERSEDYETSETEEDPFEERAIHEEEHQDEHQEEYADSPEEDTLEEVLTDEEAELIDEISFEDIIFEEGEEFVELDEFGETDDILAGLNDGIAETEAEGISGGLSSEDLRMNYGGEDDSYQDLDDHL